MKDRLLNLAKYRVKEWNIKLVSLKTSSTLISTSLKTSFCLHLHKNNDKCYLYNNKTKICEVKVIDKMHLYMFCLGSVSKGFAKDKI